MTGFIADIHGNLPALETALEYLDNAGCEEIYSLGDVAGYYPFINECCEKLRNRNIPNLMGNHDGYLAFSGNCPRSDSVNRCIAFQRSEIRSDNLEWLRGSPAQFRTDDFFAVHGSLDDPTDGYTYDFVFPENEDVLRYLTAHTHIPTVKRLGNKVYCNPGSVGQPRDGDPRLSFAILDDSGEFEIVRLSYDIDAAAAAMNKAGFPEYFYQNLYRGLPIGAR